MTGQTVDLEGELTRFVCSQLGDRARVSDLRPAGGHAGLTFLFAVELSGSTARYVLRLPPRGVRRKGNTDVYRQVPLLRALHGAGLSVPAIRWASPDEDWFRLPFFIMDRLPGRTFVVWDPDPAFERAVAAIHSLWEQAAVLLADFHRFDWKASLDDWESARPLTDEICFWRPIYERAPQADWIEAARSVEQALIQSIPADAPIGLVHGDYQLGNILFEHGRPTGVIDWELAHIGAQTLDLGWLMMMADPHMWHPNCRARHPLPVERLIDAYERAMGGPVANAYWYQALAGYRFGAIACLNVKLHRKSQREDAFWEQIALSIPRLFGRADEILRKTHVRDRAKYGNR